MNEVSDGVLSVDRHHRGAQFIIGSVQTDSQVDLAFFGSKAVDHGDEADGGYGEATCPQVEPCRVVKAINGGQGGIIVHKGLSHAHDDDIGNDFTFLFEQAGIIQHLFDDLARGEIALESHLAGSAEHAIHGATRLGGNAQGLPFFVVHQYRLDGTGIRQGKERFDGLVIGRDEFARRGERGKTESLGQLLA